MKRNGRAFLAPMALALAVACSGSGDGCTGCSGLEIVPYPVEPPTGGSVQPNVVRARVTSSALEFFRKHLDLLLGQFLTIEGDRAYYYLDESLFPVDSPILLRDGCLGTNPEDLGDCASPTFRSSISFDVAALRDNLSLEWLPPDQSGKPGLRFSLNDAEIFLDLAMVSNLYDAGSGIDLRNAVCHVYDLGDLAAVKLGHISFDVRLDVSDGAIPTLSGETVNADIDLGGTGENSAINLTVKTCNAVDDPNCDDAMCACVGDCSYTDADPAYKKCKDICHLVDLFAQLGGFITQLLQPILDALKPDIAGFVSQALIEALAAVPLTVEGKVDLATLLGSTFEKASPLHLKVSASGEVGVSGFLPGKGLDVALDGGVTPASPAACAFGATPPDLSALVGPGPQYTGFVEVQDPGDQSHMEAYHVAVSASEALFAQAFWSAYQGGLMCIALDAYQIEGLVGSSFTFTAELLQTFDQRLAALADPDSPLLVTLRPKGPPVLYLGQGGLVANDVTESLLELTLDDIELGIYMLVDEAQSQVTGLTADVVVKLGIERTPQHTLEIVVDGITVSDVRQAYNELAPGADVAGLVALVADIALDTFLGDNLRFGFDLAGTVSDALGLPVYLHLNAVRKDVGTTGISHLSVYATLCDDEDVENEENPACYVDPLAGPRAVSGLAVRAIGPSWAPRESRQLPERFWAAPSGRARLEVRAGDLADEAAEYRWRVDGGPWSRFAPAPGGELEIDSPRLFVVAEHTIEVQARPLGVYTGLSATEKLSLWVDPERPELSARYDGELLQVTTHDLGSGDAVEVRARFGEGAPWQPVQGTLDVTGRTGSVELWARDLAGNSTSLMITLDPAPSTSAGPTAESTRKAGGCAAGDGSSTWALLLFVGLWLWATSSRRRAAPAPRRR